MKTRTRFKTTHYLAAACLLIVFTIDIFTPTEFVADILYLCCIVIVFKENTRTIVCFSLVACLLIIIDMVLFDLKLHPSVSHIINRGMSIVAILITSYIAVHYGKLSQQSVLKEKQYLKALEEMLFITSHQVRKPVANILGLINTMNSDCEDLSATDLKQRCKYLYSSANELDNFIRELNTFITQTEQQNNTCCKDEPAVKASGVFARERHPVIKRSTNQISALT
jgi:hypothetical protein